MYTICVALRFDRRADLWKLGVYSKARGWGRGAGDEGARVAGTASGSGGACAEQRAGSGDPRRTEQDAGFRIHDAGFLAGAVGTARWKSGKKRSWLPLRRGFPLAEQEDYFVPLAVQEDCLGGLWD